MKTTSVTMPVKQKHKNATKKLMQGNSEVAFRYEFAIGDLMYVAEELGEIEGKKKLNAQEWELREKIKQILPLFFQLEEDCLKWSEKHRYSTDIRKRILYTEKRALEGNREAVKEYNRLAKMWHKHEPGRFTLIKPS